MIRGRGVLTGQQAAETEQEAPPSTAFRGRRNAKPAEEVHIIVAPPNRQMLQVTVVGDTGYIAHRMSQQVKKTLQEYGRTTKAERKAQPRKKKDPQAEFKASLYPVPGKKNLYGIPGAAFRKAVAAAGSLKGLSPTLLARSFWVVEEVVPVKAKWVMREDAVKLMGRTASLTYRAYVDKWEATLTINYDADIVSPETLVNLLNKAGSSVGVGDWRLEKFGRYGAFHVKGSKPTSFLPTASLG